ncbi:MAG: DUF1653 domain-containing protein [Clostridia bacterium]|nr:DUF1653 domain-containing protein [Clostridia bacterium]
MIVPGKYISQSGIAYKVIANAINSENEEQFVIYREVYNNKRIFTCSKQWWETQGIIPMENYTRTGVTMYSSETEKMRLFMSLFIGRDDVYAKRWENKKGSSGYSPACANEWVPNVCMKPNMKCAECENKNYLPMSPKVINDHLRGNITVGIYPLLKDETCRFLAIDFDDEMWMQDISAVNELCKERFIPAYIERSRSGNGGHLWVFFNENISAATVRKLGSCILTAAMDKRHEIKFSSYDRLFPNQDTMPNGGFGNLIALPLQKQPRSKGNSMFVNERFQPYADQWSFLNDIIRVSEGDVKRYIKDLGNMETGELYEDNSDNSRGAE